MRLKTEIIIAAELRHADSLGLFATVVKKGDVNAGQIYIIINKNNCEFIMIAPAFGASIDEDGQRLWCYPLGEDSVTQADIDAYLSKIEKFDCDVYVLEIEDKSLEYRPNGAFKL